MKVAAATTSFTDWPTLDAATLWPALAEAVQAHAEPSLLVLCSGSRLAQWLQLRFAEYQRTQGVQVWAAAVITTPADFLDTAGDALGDGPSAGSPTRRRLSEAEREVLWRRIVADGDPDSGSQVAMLNRGDATRQALDAWRLCQQYGIKLPLPELSPETERFNAWAERYRADCAALGRCDPDLWRAQLIEALANGHGTLPARVVFAGYRELPAWLHRLAQAFEQRGAALARLLPTVHAEGEVKSVRAPNGEQELRAAAEWVREQALLNPAARIGVLVPDLAAQREALLRVFDEVLCPSRLRIDGSAHSRPYNLSLGAPLAAQGVVQTAMQLLTLGVVGLDAAAAGSLLCAQHWGAAPADSSGDTGESAAGGRHWLARAALDRRLREEGHLQVTWRVLRELAWREPDLYAPFADMDETCRRALQAPPAPPSQWAERFAQWLKQAGWPGTRVSSETWQAVAAWREVLAQFGRLGDVIGECRAGEALAQLRALLQQRVFQPRSPAVPIQVMGVLEAEGMDFDALWVMGLDDEHWPPPAHPNPFIPHLLQRAAGLPAASAALQRERAAALTEGWRRHAGRCVFSWSALDGDRPLQASPLIAAEAAQANASGVAGRSGLWQALAASGRWQRVADTHGQPVTADAILPGGTRLFGDQARCPFRGYATHRLGARALETATYGPSHADRGNLVHQVMERLWTRWRTHAALIELDADARAAQIAAIVAEVLTEHARKAPQRFPPRLVQIEQQRLIQLIGQWLDVEAHRPPFTVIELEGIDPGTGDVKTDAAHADGVVSFAGLRLCLRADRVDALENGGLLVLDYKTGQRKALPWHDGRPEEPQLLIYALTRPGIEALAYARIGAGAIGFEGIAAQAGTAPGIQSYDVPKQTRDADGWDALMGRFRGELTTLADEIRRGNAAVTPKHVRQSCRDCQLHAVCRIREAGKAFSADDDEIDDMQDAAA